MPCRPKKNLICLDPGLSSKGLGTNLKLFTRKNAWLHWTLLLGPLSKVALILSFLQNLLWSYKYSTDISCLHIVCWVQKVGRNRDQWFFFFVGRTFASWPQKKWRCKWYKRLFFLEKMGSSRHIMRKISEVAIFRQRSIISSKHRKTPNFFYFPFSDLYPNLVNSSCGWWPIHLTHKFEKKKKTTDGDPWGVISCHRYTLFTMSRSHKVLNTP
jgi:hypothetical protein